MLSQNSVGGQSDAMREQCWRSVWNDQRTLSAGDHAECFSINRQDCSFTHFSNKRLSLFIVQISDQLPLTGYKRVKVFLKARE